MSFAMLDILLLLGGAFLAAAISGAAGFGGALLLLPLLTHTVGVTSAVPLLTLAQLVGNASRVAMGWRQIRWRPVLTFLLAAVPAAAIGALSFVALPKPVVVRAVGAAVIAFVALRARGLLKFQPGRTMLLAGGGAVGFLSGLVGSAGPLGAAIFLSLNLPPMAYIASEATTAIALHALKSAIYQSTLPLGTEFWPLAFGLGAAMILGTFAGKRAIERLPLKRFEQMVAILLVIVGAQMLVFA